MKFIHDTVSVCNHCYRHIPGVVFERDGKIWLSKKCEEHGIMEEVVEVDAEFYYNINRVQYRTIDSIMFESTDRCQLSCPHCYHLPDNKTTDLPLDLLLAKVLNYPRKFKPMIAGAEALLYKDIIPLAHTLEERFGLVRILTNGIRLADADFAKELLSNRKVLPAVGLNHYTYQGKAVHAKQLRGIANAKEYGELSDINYTLEDLDHLPEIFEEIEQLRDDKLKVVRIRAGSFIGRSSDTNRNYLSITIKKLKELLGDELVAAPEDDNPYHHMFKWRGLSLRIIQWPDVKNIDLEELTSGPWANFTNGPISNFVHQVILRDAFINNKLTPLDEVPEYYRPVTGHELNTRENPHWKVNWSGPTPMSKLEYVITDPRKMPVAIKKVIPLAKG